MAAPEQIAATAPSSKGLLARRAWGRLRRLERDEDGAAMVFAAITLFALGLSVMFIYQIGLVSADRLQIQGAADAAAYSAAQVEANSLNAIGQINDGMAFMTYALMRHTVDAVVYSTLNEFRYHQPTPAQGQYGFVLMGGDTQPYEGERRYQHVERRFQNTVGKAKQWAVDLHYAGRLIMATTPRLVRETAAEIASLNGATHFAISEDLELAFKIQEQGGGAGAGFTERAYGGSDTQFADPLFKRYAGRDVPAVTSVSSGMQQQNERQELPSWFDGRTGKLKNTYSQVRLCWNQSDWAHDGPVPHGGEYSQFQLGAPNGHWHDQHQHYTIDPTTGQQIPLPPHGGVMGSTSIPGGHIMEDPSIHSLAYDNPEPHHYARQCPTCRADTHSSGARWTEVKKSSNDARNFRPFELRFDSILPRPLTIREPLLRSGVTVVTYRPGRGIGELFPASEWGMLAVASAQVGYQTDQGVLPLKGLSGEQATYGGSSGGERTFPYGGRSSADASSGRPFVNLFYSSTPSEGARFGARLVPISNVNTSHPDLAEGRGLRALLADGSRWYSAERNPTRSAPPGLKYERLAEFITVESQRDLNAFWH